MTVEQTKFDEGSGWVHDEFTLTPKLYEKQKVKVQIEPNSKGIWLGTNESPTGARISIHEIDELITVLLYAKHVLENIR